RSNLKKNFQGSTRSMTIDILQIHRGQVKFREFQPKRDSTLPQADCRLFNISGVLGEWIMSSNTLLTYKSVLVEM
ncbi:hypothetical protein PFISCL1PPCAC_21431, partial [Pristionchus fissidentatus]